MGSPTLVRVKPAAVKGAFINSHLLAAGEQVWVDLEALGIADLDKDRILEAGDPDQPVFADLSAPPGQHPPIQPVPQPKPAFDGTIGTGAGVTIEPEPPIRRDGDLGGLADEAGALVRDNTKPELLKIAEAEQVPGVSEDNNKAEIADKIVAHRAA